MYNLCYASGMKFFNLFFFLFGGGGGGNQTDVMQGLGLGSAYSATKGLLTSVNR